jgi:hypothetical protein
MKKRVKEKSMSISKVLQSIRQSHTLMACLILALVVSAAVYAKQEQKLNSLRSSASGFTCDFYAATNGAVSGNGSVSSPWDLETALWESNIVTSGKTLCLRGGTYVGKFNSFLSGATVRSAPGEWAKIDGYKQTTLTAPINSSQQAITIANTQGLFSGEAIAVDTEVMQIDTVTNSTTLWVNRGWGASIGGAVAHAAGAPVVHIGNQLLVQGSNSTYRDFEVYSSYPQRDLEPGTVTNQGCCGFYNKVRGDGIAQNDGTGNNYVNLVIHDNLDGIFIGSNTSNTTVYGNLIYNNGSHYYDSGEGRETASGHGIYTENVSGFSHIYNNIIVNNFNFNGQFYGVTGAYVGGDLQDNIFGNAGSPLGGLTSPNLRNFNIIYGTDQVKSPTANIVRNYFFAPDNAFGGTPAALGYGAGMNQATINDNYFVGSPSVVGIGNITSVTSFLRNKLFGTSADTYINKPNAAQNWNYNTYYQSSGRTVFYNGTDGVTFPAWKTQTGLDVNSTETASAMPDTAVVTPNTYDQGRANIVVFAASNPASINVNLANSGLYDGQGYSIRNAFDYNGSAVVSGTYSAANPVIALPLNGASRNVATPVGMNYTPATTLPSFGAFIVVPGDGGSTLPPAVPKINSFSANPATITSGQTATLSWSVSGATSLSISPSVGAVSGSSVSVTPTSTTTYTLTAVNTAGAVAATTTVTVNSPTPTDTTAPVASITSPVNNTTVSGTTTINATATDNVGVAGVQFKIDGVNLGSEYAGGPYSYSWDTTSTTNGTHTLTVVARDAAGNSTTSDVIVNVDNAVVISAVATPAITPNGGTFRRSLAVTISTATPGATIYYTTNGSAPTTSSLVYSGPLTITGNVTVKAIAVKSGMSNSAIASAKFIKHK